MLRKVEIAARSLKVLPDERGGCLLPVVLCDPPTHQIFVEQKGSHNTTGNHHVWKYLERTLADYVPVAAPFQSGIGKGFGERQN